MDKEQPTQPCGGDGMLERAAHGRADHTHMDCAQAQRLFDAYLDGELSPALTTELGAHRLRCPECRRTLALLEVSGHVLTTDREPDELPRDFTDRLLECIEVAKSPWTHRVRRVVYVGVPLAAAAMVALAFVGVFDRQPGEAAGHKEAAPESVRVLMTTPDAAPRSIAATDEVPVDARVLGEWLERTSKDIEAKEQAGESLQRMMDMTILQLLDVLRQAQESAENPATAPSPPNPPSDNRDIEDM